MIDFTTDGKKVDMGVRHMAGTPWHPEKMTRKEGDERRHSHRCVYFSGAEKYCSKTVGKCCGAGHCDYYEEKKPSIVFEEAKDKNLVNNIVP